MPAAKISVNMVASFDGIASNGWAVPDTNGAAGATQFVEWVNARFAVYNKSGQRIYGPAAGTSLWAGFGGACQNNNGGDPIAQYDKLADRWVMTQHATPSGPNYQCVAVSATSDATGSYHRYAFVMPSGLYPDYPKLAVWPDAYYLSVNLQDPKSNFTTVGALVCALNRNAMLNGSNASSVCFQTGSAHTSLLPSDFDGTVLPPSGSPNYFLGLDSNSLDLWQFHVDFQTPSNSSFTGPTKISVASFRKACNGGVCIPQLGVSQLLDSLGDRLMYRLAYRNFGDHESMVITHSVNPPTGASAGVRWYEIRDPGGVPTIHQQGTFSPDSVSRWMGSIAMDKAGNIAVGYSVSSGSINPGIRLTGRVPTDTLGTLEAEQSVIRGTGSQSGSNRWGDYSSMSVDPVDDCTFWYSNQYLKTTGSKNWSTRIYAFKFPACQ